MGCIAEPLGPSEASYCLSSSAPNAAGIASQRD